MLYSPLGDLSVALYMPESSDSACLLVWARRSFSLMVLVCSEHLVLMSAGFLIHVTHQIKVPSGRLFVAFLTLADQLTGTR